jgi:phosphopantothenoylcysteine decarboxylase/phosphopantothenate--cysteine ligase
MAAAVADFRPRSPVREKIKREESGGAEPIALVANPDILAGLARDRDRGELAATTTLVGFAAETGDERAAPLAHARAKLARKGVDLLVLNDVSGGAIFGQPDTVVHLLSADGAVAGPVSGPKRVVAHRIWDRVVGIRANRA